MRRCERHLFFLQKTIELSYWLDKISFRTRRCACRDSTNQNASFVEWFSRLERAVFRGICGEIFAIFQVCVDNFDTIPPWKDVGTLYLDSSCVSFKYFAFLSVCDKIELLGHVQAAMMIWALFSPFFLDSLLVTVSGFIGLFRSTCYFNFLLCKFWGLPGSTPVSFPVRRGVESAVEWRDCLGQVAQLPGNVLRNLPKWKPTWSE